MKAALLSILTIVALVNTVPPSMIVSDVIEYIPVPVSTWMYSPVTFGSFFTEIPKASVIFTAQEHQKLRNHQVSTAGWIIDIQSITQTGATIALKASSAFNYLKFKYVATQGDRLQVFKVQINGNQGQSYNSTYFQSNLVQFDSSNLPNEVFIANQVASYVTVTANYRIDFGHLPSIPDGNGGGTVEVSAIPFNQLSLVFSNNLFHYYQYSSYAYSAQITLLIHRVNLPTETAVNGMNRVRDQMYDNTLQKDMTVALYNNVTVGVGQGIMGLIGFYALNGYEREFATVCSLSINFTAPATISQTIAGYGTHYMDLWTGFYVVNCHSSCATCNGVFDHNCLTCYGLQVPANGKCPPGCPPHVRTFPNFTCAPCAAGCVSCSSTFNCTSCQKQKYYRVPVVDSNNLCPCLPGYYENTDLSCVRCPPSLFCATCELSRTSVLCTSCNCAQYRDKVGGACVCISGYREYPNTPGPYCQKNL